MPISFAAAGGRQGRGFAHGRKDRLASTRIDVFPGRVDKAHPCLDCGELGETVEAIGCVAVCGGDAPAFLSRLKSRSILLRMAQNTRLTVYWSFRFRLVGISGVARRVQLSFAAHSGWTSQ
jgi:hypothetical protein